MKPIRCFVAFDLPAGLRAQLREVMRELDGHIPEGVVRWVRPEGIHLTLKFLGDVETESVPGIEAALASAAGNGQRLSFEVGGLGCFPSPSRARVVWVGVHEPSGAMRRLHADIERELADLGVQREDRPFSPHLTLGRVRREAGASASRLVGEAVQRAVAPALGQVDAGPLVLFRSELRPGGAIYSKLATFGLSGES